MLKEFLLYDSIGEVNIIVNNSEVTSLYSGAYFGEMALMSSERRNATVIAKVKTDCLILESGLCEAAGSPD